MSDSRMEMIRCEAKHTSLGCPDSLIWSEADLKLDFSAVFGMATLFRYNERRGINNDDDVRKCEYIVATRYQLSKTSQWPDSLVSRCGGFKIYRRFGDKS